MFRSAELVLLPTLIALSSVVGVAADGKPQTEKADPSYQASQKSSTPETNPQPAASLPSSQELRPEPAVIRYVNGQLTIISKGSTLAEILSALRTQISIAIDFPPGTGTEPTAATLGPGPVRDVLAALLNKSHFDYAMIGSPSNPVAVERVVLIPRSNDSIDVGATPSPAVATNSAVQPAPLQNAPVAQQPTQQAATETAEPTSDNTEEAADDSNEPTTQVTVAAEDPLPEAAQEVPGVTQSQPAAGQVPHVPGVNGQPGNGPGAKPQPAH